jgi:hypothetical protein
MNNRYRFLDAGSFTTTQDSMAVRPGWEEPSRTESQRLMDAADELAAQHANGATISQLAKINPELAQQLMKLAAGMIGYRGAGANALDEHTFAPGFDRFEDGEYEPDEDGEVRTAGVESIAVMASEADLMDELEARALEEGYESAQQLSEQDPDRFTQVMRAAARNVGHGR